LVDRDYSKLTADWLMDMVPNILLIG